MMNKDECEIIILIGSETGSTSDFGKRLSDALVAAERTVHMADLNDYTTYDKAKHIVIITATYGEGEPTSNANQFVDLLGSVSPIQGIQFSVVGFGSTAYPNYCQFAITVDGALRLHSAYEQLLPLHKINNQSNTAFSQWASEWSDASGIDFELKGSSIIQTKIGLEVISRTALNVDDTFIIRLRPQEDVEFQSGDLLSINVKEDDRARLYSIGKIDDDVLLSVKLHKDGRCSNYLNNLSEGDLLKASLRRNTTFHLPDTSPHVIMIANGTGIAPFIGMLDENNRCIETTLFWGGRTELSYDIYNDWLRHTSEEDRLSEVKLAYSQEGEKEYVQDLLPAHSDLIRHTLKNKGEILICGSLSMQKDTLIILDSIIGSEGDALSDYQDRGQVKMDCY